MNIELFRPLNIKYAIYFAFIVNIFTICNYGELVVKHKALAIYYLHVNQKHKNCCDYPPAISPAFHRPHRSRRS